MDKLKAILLLLLVFILTVVIAFYFENNYRVLVRHFFNFFQGAKIKFIAKDFHLFASPYMLAAFGLFSVSLTVLLYGQSKRRRLIYLSLTILLFFITTFVSTYIDSTGYVDECTACQDGVRRLHYNEINYDFHFITSLVIGLLPLLWTFLKKQISKRRQRKPSGIPP
ncbi:hypothetical protein [Limnovirga soli]|uniref:Uncharacterized protein n=1 Tax=Limnovirga soli TaxID=2656915 RepID=A0A8J8FK02_9BACT|nr:hypothetical protein [Limnovirga soli]NNV58027.1 hypothetical protein [Limnovirga soli]